MIALDASDHNTNSFLEELLLSVSASTKDVESIKSNFDTIFSSTYDKMQDYDKDYTFSLAEKFYNLVDRIPDYSQLYALVTEIDPESAKLRASEDAEALIALCREHESTFREYLQIQDALLRIYSHS